MDVADMARKRWLCHSAFKGVERPDFYFFCDIPYTLWLNASGAQRLRG